jgi:hypothetical protein
VTLFQIAQAEASRKLPRATSCIHIADRINVDSLTEERDMRWEMIGVVADLVAAAAVVISIVYLAVQIRQNTKATRVVSSDTINNSLTAILSAIRSDGEFAEIWLRGCQNLDSLGEVEKARFSHHLLDMLNLATYVDELEKQGISNTHIDYIPWMTMLYRENPGIRAFIDSLEGGWAGSMDLYRRLTDTELAIGTNIYQSERKKVSD